MIDHNWKRGLCKRLKGQFSETEIFEKIHFLCLVYEISKVNQWHCYLHSTVNYTFVKGIGVKEKNRKENLHATI